MNKLGREWFLNPPNHYAGGTAADMGVHNFRFISRTLLHPTYWRDPWYPTCILVVGYCLPLLTTCTMKLLDQYDLDELKLVYLCLHAALPGNPQLMDSEL
ncbi:MAG: hypothetical protein ABIP04_13985, partial [Sulfuriferula sp.]